MSGYKNLASIYFTALGRERYSSYKTNNNMDDIKDSYLDDI
ncbi:MAG: hypothetical protein U0L98_06715 [Clostridia bacterium]|nr:hypothetical protein [Clostridia bacterium]